MAASCHVHITYYTFDKKALLLYVKMGELGDDKKFGGVGGVEGDNWTVQTGWANHFDIYSN